MRAAIFGLGYVGTVMAACLAELGHSVVGVDVNPSKVDMVNQGLTPVTEERIGDLVADGVESGRLRATTSARVAVDASDVAFVCVGTPSAANGALSTAYLERVVDEIGAALPTDRRFVVVIRSTMLPGTCDEVVIPRLEAASGLTEGRDFAVCVHPEFLREGSSVADFFSPPKTVVGGDDGEDMTMVSALYGGFAGPVFHVPRPVAEMSKYVDNSYHALKVAFANEIGALCKVAGIDSHQVMDVFKADTKLNISTAYLTPGWIFGGSCLPKDLRAITHHARHVDVDVPVLDAVLRSNDAHFGRVFSLVEASGARRVGLFGLASKDGTDDLRESPMVHLAEQLLGRGYEVLIHDVHVSSSRLVGANREYIESHLPHLSGLLRTSVDEVLDHAEVCVIGSAGAAAAEAVKRSEGRMVVDLVRLPAVDGVDRYEGVCW